MLQKALDFAQEAHKGQMRKFQNVPYIWHCISVAKLVEVYKDSKNMDELRVAGLLHDTVEDTDVTLDQIANEFNYKVAALVEELTNDIPAGMSKPEYMKKKMYNMSSYALVIKLCDRLDNCLDLKLCPDDFRERYTKNTDIVMHYLMEESDHFDSFSGKGTDTQKRIVRRIIQALDEASGKNVYARRRELGLRK